MALHPSRYQRNGNYNMSRVDKTLIILAQEPSHLAGVKRPENGKWYDIDLKEFQAGNISRKDAIRLREELKSVDSPYHKMVADFQKKYKDDVLVFDLSFYELGKKHNLKSSSVYTLSDIINRNKKDSEETLTFDATNYTELVEMMNACEHLIYIGEAQKGLSFDLFIDDFSTVDIITTPSSKINLSVYGGGDVKDVKHVNITEEITLENVKQALARASKKLTPNEINYSNPITKDFDFLIEKWNKRIAEKPEYSKPIDSAFVEKVRKVYPFLKDIPDSAVESLYMLYCKDTTRASLINKPVVREDFFIDLFLYYTLYDVSAQLSFLTARPKISFLKAYNDQNYRDMKRFLNVIKKNSILDKAI